MFSLMMIFKLEVLDYSSYDLSFFTEVLPREFTLFFIDVGDGSVPVLLSLGLLTVDLLLLVAILVNFLDSFTIV